MLLFDYILVYEKMMENENPSLYEDGFKWY